MFQSSRWLRVVCIAMVAAFSAVPWEMAYPETTGPVPSLKFLGIEKSGDNPIGLQAWLDNGHAHAFQTGDRVIMSFQTDRDGYAMVLNVIPDRSVHILFPNKEHPDNAVRKGNVYTLFGDDSRTRLSLGKQVEKGQIVLCVSPKPFDLAPLKTQGDEPGIVLNSEAKTKVLRERLQAMSTDQGFNRIVLPFREGKEYGFETELTMTPEPGPPGTRALPGAIESERPGTVTGTQGVREKMEPK